MKLAHVWGEASQLGGVLDFGKAQHRGDALEEDPHWGKRQEGRRFGRSPAGVLHSTTP